MRAVPGAEGVVDGRGLCRRFGDAVALDGVDLVVPAGTVHGLVGANGAGKTTLLSMLLGLTAPDAGSLRLFGRTQQEAGRTWLDRVAGFVETPAFYPHLSGRRNLAVLAALDGRPGDERIDDQLAQVGLAAAAGERVRGYSLGMRQRLGLAAALMRDPALLVLDEPTNGLDPAGARQVRAAVRRLAADGVAVLLSSHDMAQVAELCDSVTVLHRGRVAFSGAVEGARALAPDPSFRVRTDDDSTAVRLAGQVPGLTAERDPDGLRLVGDQALVDRYVVELGRAGVAVRRLSEETPALEALFLQLTAADDRAPRPVVGVSS